MPVLAIWVRGKYQSDKNRSVIFTRAVNKVQLEKLRGLLMTLILQPLVNVTLVSGVKLIWNLRSNYVVRVTT